jgi:hypothetical protein
MAAVERTAHATPYAPQASVRRPIFLRLKSRRRCSNNLIRLLASLPGKRMAEFNMLARYIFAGNFYHSACHLQGFDYSFNRLAGN